MKREHALHLAATAAHPAARSALASACVAPSRAASATRERPAPTGQIAFGVVGKPAPGGSKKSFVSHSTGRIVTVDDCERNGAWRDRVAYFARRAMGGASPFTVPLVARVLFLVTRPKDHFGAGRNASVVKPSAPPHPGVKPDVTKLWRAVEDAMTGIVWRDDALVIHQAIVKAYATTPGMYVVIDPAPRSVLGEWESSPLLLPAPARPADAAGKDGAA